MKYIFLDIDGVLNNNRTVTRSPDGFVGISDNLCKRLEKIIKATNAKVVLTSSWKDCSSPQDLNYMKKRLKRHFALPIGQTSEKTPGLRGTGIKKYLETHPCDEFVILDDFDFNFQEENLLDHLVLTNPTVGLTDDDVLDAIAILKGKILTRKYTKIEEWGYHKE